MRVLVGPARAWAGVSPPEPGASLSWSGVPASITRSLGTTYDLSQHVEYDGEGTLTYSSIGTSLSGTGISLNSSTGVLTIDGGASTGTVSAIQVRVTDGTLTEDSATFAVVSSSMRPSGTTANALPAMVSALMPSSGAKPA